MSVLYNWCPNIYEFNLQERRFLECRLAQNSRIFGELSPRHSIWPFTRWAQPHRVWQCRSSRWRHPGHLSPDRTPFRLHWLIGMIHADWRLHENHRVKLVVFGSTGGTGRELVRQALELEHEVTAFARHAQALGISHERLRIVEGDALQQVSVDAAIRGQDSAQGSFSSTSRYSLRAPSASWAPWSARACGG